MFKLFSFLLILAVAFAAPAPEPGVLTPIAYGNNIAYNAYPQALSYAAVPAPISYNGPIIASYPAAPIAYAKVGY